MDSIAGLPFYPLELSKAGAVFRPEQKTAIEHTAGETAAARLTDLFVVSHGWNNDMADARQLYDALFTNISALIPGHASIADRKFAIVGVFWSSKKFAESELIPAGGIASLEAGGSGVDSSALKRKLESLKGTFDAPDDAALDHAKALVDEIETSTAKQKEFVDTIRSLLPQHAVDTHEDASDKFLRRPAVDLLNALSAPSMFNIPLPSGGGAFALGVDDAAGHAAGLADLFSGIKAAAWRLLNYATYYQMKERAGVVGKGLNSVLASVRQLRPDLRIHLIGHSFGARVVTAAVDGPAGIRPASLCLLQGAFSHNGFTEKFDGHSDGFFRKVVSQSKVDGPILATHTVNDRAVGIAYPIASRISADNTAAIGDATDVYGGIGRNGAVKMRQTECVKGRLLPQTQAYQFASGKVHNLLADEYVRGHCDVTGMQIANAIVCAAGG